MINRVLSVLIADGSKKFRKEVRDALESNGEYKVIGSVSDGREIPEIIRKEHPDILIMDITLPFRDGMEVLEDIDALDLRRPPLTVVTSAVSTDNVIRQCMDTSANYFLAKPSDGRSVSKIVKTLVKDKRTSMYFEIKDQDIKNKSYKKNTVDEILEEKITNLILKIGVPAHIKGYQYIKTAILYSVLNGNFLQSVTKELYPLIANIHNTTPPRVERAIRHAIEVAWNRGEEETLQNIFGYTIESNKGKPTNSEFIAMIADRLRVQNQSILTNRAI